MALVAVIILVPLLAAVMGYVGGGPAAILQARPPAADLTVITPPTLRSGNLFETKVIATPRNQVGDLTVAIEEPLLRRVSIDTVTPEAESAGFEDGSFEFSFGPAQPGKPVEVKFDGQIQPWGWRTLHGEIMLLDGKTKLAAVPVTVRVLP
ncbi:hypothetical protein ACFO0A_14750 [Novosphingobium tardum]|uniref:Uncharacterized protein n=1 Tax=Novosphingobium tardum TaxID=1538021 RepID=A0ABV8RTZ4_9SPHN